LETRWHTHQKIINLYPKKLYPPGGGFFYWWQTTHKFQSIPYKNPLMLLYLRGMMKQIKTCISSREKCGPSPNPLLNQI
jgi:hypothetical protein